MRKVDSSEWFSSSPILPVQLPKTMAPVHLLALLEQAANREEQTGIQAYSLGCLDRPPRRLTYRELLRLARDNAPKIRLMSAAAPRKICLLHFDDHLDNVEFLWSVLAAGFVPAISPPLTNDAEQRRRHLLHLQKLLHNPVIITREHLLPEFATLKGDVNILTAEEIHAYGGRDSASDEISIEPSGTDLAVLMLTSGSTGNAKAVTLSHSQILHAINGKSTFHDTGHKDTFLNWIGLDHVANLTEIHLHAMGLAAEQVHVAAADLVANPLAFIQLIGRHGAAYTFAPNFFLASLRKALEKPESQHTLQDLDISSLRALISGGEANVTETCSAVVRLLKPFGAPSNVIRPGFGMTETCAGSIYNLECPAYDVASGTEFTSLGTSIPGLTLRITRDDQTVAKPNEIGDLQVSGPVVFNEYFNNTEATAAAFTEDGWFITGDKAYLDTSGKLHLSGRAKDVIIINGVKHLPHELESAIEDAGIQGVVPSYTAVFPHRPQGSDTEVICVVYLPSYEELDVAARLFVRQKISEVAIRQTGARPYCILPLDKAALPKTTLGKLSRPKLRTAYESGVFAAYKATDDSLIRGWQEAHGQKPATEGQQVLFRILSDILEVPENALGIDTSLFELGISSVELLRLKSAIEKSLKLPTPVAITTFMAHPTIRSLALALQHEKPKEYNPAVILRPASDANTDARPLWLIHPGVGEVLIFLHLAKHIGDRPVYALRSRGFDGEPFFRTLQECVLTYHTTIKRLQPQGPYAIAGYSYGGTLAFEIAKFFESAGDEVKFLGIIDQPPHIKARMRHSDWTNVVLRLSCFLNIIDDAYAASAYADLCKLSHSEVLEHILARTTPAHLDTMAMDQAKLSRWADLALNNHAIAREYEPIGMVKNLDVFFANTPDKFYAQSPEEMMERHMGKWRVHGGKGVGFYMVEGNHDDMLRPEHAQGFWKVMGRVLRERGV